MYQPLKQYCTSSCYEGTINNLGFTGTGTYTYPHGVKYEGQFKDGHFHGQGNLIYPKGSTIEGTWHKGKLQNYGFKLSDGVEVKESWDYLSMPNRQYTVETDKGFQPPGKENVCAKHVVIPEKCYDTGDNCYYDDEKKLIISQDYCIKGIVKREEESLIKEKYRQELDKPAGYSPELYEYWCAGRKVEIDEIYNFYLNQKIIEEIEKKSKIDGQERDSLE